MIDKLLHHANQRNGEYIGTYFDKYKFYQFRCNKGHMFSLRGGSISKNAWCPKCQNEIRIQKLRDRNKQGLKVPQDFETLKTQLYEMHGVTLITKLDYYTSSTKVSVIDINGQTIIKRLNDIYRFGAGKKTQRKTNFYKTLIKTLQDKCKSVNWEFVKLEPLSRSGKVYYYKKGVLYSKQLIYFNKNRHLLNKRISQQQEDISAYIKSLGCSVENGKRFILSKEEENIYPWYFKHFGKKTNRNRYCELDIYIPEKNIAIEYHGAKFHDAFGNEGEKHRRLPRFKYEFCKSKNIRLIQIYEYEWSTKKSQIKNYLKSILVGNDIKLYARKCQIQEIPNKEMNEFYDKHHLKGKCYSMKFNIGLYFNKELVMGLTVGGEGRDYSGYSVTRMCVKHGVTVVGGLSRLSKHILTKFKSVSTLIDLMTFTGDGWLSSGWTFDKINPPNYVYFDMNKRKKVDKQKFSKIKDEFETVKSYGNYAQLWDCGKLRLTLE